MNDAVAAISSKITRVSDHAMLARLHVSQWTARKTDRKLADRIAEETKGDKAMHSHSRRIIAPKAFETIQKTVSEARQFHKDNTLPWMYDGVGILYSKNFFDYTTRMRSLEGKFNDAVAVFLPSYPQLMKDAKVLLGDSFDENDYPHPQVVAGLFSFQMHFDPVQIGSDFRVPDIGDEAQREIQKQIDRRAAEAIDNMVKAVWDQIFAHVNHLVERLKIFDERENAENRDPKDKSGWFRDSLVENIRDLVERLPRLNITEDARIEDMRVRLYKQLCATDADDLRTMPLARKDVITQAEKILAEVGEFLA